MPSGILTLHIICGVFINLQWRSKISGKISRKHNIQLILFSGGIRTLECTKNKCIRYTSHALNSKANNVYKASQVLNLTFFPKIPT